LGCSGYGWEGGGFLGASYLWWSGERPAAMFPVCGFVIKLLPASGCVRILDPVLGPQSDSPSADNPAALGSVSQGSLRPKAVRIHIRAWPLGLRSIAASGRGRPGARCRCTSPVSGSCMYKQLAAQVNRSECCPPVRFGLPQTRRRVLRYHAGGAVGQAVGASKSVERVINTAPTYRLQLQLLK